MEARNRTCLLVAVITVLTFGQSRSAFADGSVRFWQTTRASFDVNKDWKVTAEEQVKLRQDVSALYYEHTDLGFVYKDLAKGVDLGFNYKQVFCEDDDGDWSRENRPHLNVMIRGRLSAFDLFDRSRFEYRDREDERDLWRYVHLLKVAMPFELTRFKLRPYVADQVYLNLDGQAFDKNRIYSGVSFELSKNVRSDFCYIWQSAKSDGCWEDLDALGLLLSIRF
ncbi:MAG: DUF2490 domain-containing protein [Sedimentisphaerales bacterium]